MPHGLNNGNVDNCLGLFTRDNGLSVTAHRRPSDERNDKWKREDVILASMALVLSTASLLPYMPQKLYLRTPVKLGRPLHLLPWPPPSLSPPPLSPPSTPRPVLYLLSLTALSPSSPLPPRPSLSSPLIVPRDASLLLPPLPSSPSKLPLLLPTRSGSSSSTLTAAGTPSSASTSPSSFSALAMRSPFSPSEMRAPTR